MSMPNISSELLNKWRYARRGNANPQNLTNPVWQWLVRNPMSAYQAAKELGLPHDGEQAGWCFERYGQSRTELPDGRVVFIAGEHEDHYDPDFFIYNDVVVVTPDSRIAIYGYPADAFPPTDFHSATVAGDRIILVGCLGYPKDRKAALTQVVTLDCNDLSAAVIQSHGVGPGWLHGHDALLSDDGQSLVVSGGKIDRCDNKMLVENIDEWKLHLADWRWERLTARQWARFEVSREDRKMFHLWHMRQALWSKRVGWDDYEPAVDRLTEALGKPPRLEIVAELYRPPIAHDVMPEDENDHRVYRIRIGGIVVRYVEDTFTVQATVEGDLPEHTVFLLRRDLASKLESLEQAAISIRTI